MTGQKIRSAKEGFCFFHFSLTDQHSDISGTYNDIMDLFLFYHDHLIAVFASHLPQKLYIPAFLFSESAIGSYDYISGM